MRAAARWGLKRTICVSEAVRRACVEAGYDATALAVVHNGLPDRVAARTPGGAGPWRLGFLGAFSERKGLNTLFAILADLSGLAREPWEIHIAGEAQDEAGRSMIGQIHGRFGQAPWWSRVHWHGWVTEPARFLDTLDLLLVPSSEFDPFPTVLLEAAQSGVAVLAADVGGVREIVVDGETGVLFDPMEPAEAAKRLARLLDDRKKCNRMASEAVLRVRGQFSVGKMVAHYIKVYSTLAPHV